MKRGAAHSMPGDLYISAVARAVSVFGNGIVLTALLLRFHDTGSGRWAIAGLLAAGSAPIVLLAPVVGLMIDRYDNRKLIVASSLWQGATCALLAFVGQLSVVLALVLLNALGTAVIVPAYSALTSLMVPDRQVSAATSVQQGGHSLALLVGPPVGGLLTGLTGGAKVPLLIAAAAFLVATAPALLIAARRQPGPATPRQSGPATPRQSGPATERLRIRDGVDVLLGDTAGAAALAILLVLAAQVTGVAAVFLVRDTFRASALAYGMFTGAYATGVMVGTALASLLPTPRRTLLAGPLLAVAVGAAFVGVGLSTSLAAAFVLYAVAGVGGGVVGAATVTLLLRTSKPAPGRTLASYTGLVRAAALAAYGLGGLVVGPLSPREVYLLSGTVALLAALVTAPALRKARVPTAESRNG
jgi:MFS family permease